MVRLQRLPVIGDYFVHEIPPSDNVSSLILMLSVLGLVVGRVLMGCGLAVLNEGLV